MWYVIAQGNEPKFQNHNSIGKQAKTRNLFTTKMRLILLPIHLDQLIFRYKGNLNIIKFET